MGSAERSNDFGRLLQEFRLRAGLTQEALAERAGLGRRSLQGLERGESGPRRATLDRLVEALVLSPTDQARFEAAARPSPRRRSPEPTPPIRLSASPRSEAVPRHNLPTQLTSFVGRETEMREIASLLVTKRLVTLTGAGGGGKTRLAFQVTAEITASYPDGAWLVELAPLADPSLVPQAIANALGVPERPDQPILNVLMNHLQPRHCLLLLDNCEHLVGACAQVATSLLQSCPQLSVLTTSRQVLRVPGEVQWRVPPLPALDPTDLSRPSLDLAVVQSQYPAIRLFVERAQAAQPRFSLTSQNLPSVARICWQLDGLPLAIELAAARVNAMEIELIADRLDQRFQLLTTGSRVDLPRQQTLRGTIDWSYELLSEPDRVLFRRLAVFAGGFTLEAVEGICLGDGLLAADVLPTLLRLADQSLLEGEAGGQTGRYRLLETIREYAHQYLVLAGETSLLRQRHLSWYLQWAKETERKIWGPELKRWVDQLEREHDNLRAALRYCTECDVASGLYLAASLHRFWLDRGHFAEGQRWLGEMLQLGCADPRARAVGLVALGALTWHRGGWVEAVSSLEAGVDLLRSEGLSRDLSYALGWLGAAVIDAGESERARALLEESVEVARITGDPLLEGVSLSWLGDLAFTQGDRAAARERLRKCLELSRNAGTLRVTAWALRNLASVALADRDYHQARESLSESLALAFEIGYGAGVTGAVANLGVLAEREGDYRRAVRLIAGATRDSWIVVGSRGAAAERGRSLEVSRATLGDDAFAAAWTEGQAMTLEQAVNYALSGTPSP